MKSVFTTALVMIIGLTACTDNPSKPHQRVNVDGHYVSISYTGSKDQKGKQNINGHVINLYSVRGDELTLLEIDPQKRKYVRSTYHIEVYGSHARVYPRTNSCIDQETLKASHDIATWSRFKKDRNGYIISEPKRKNGKTEYLLKISADEKTLIESRLVSEFQLQTTALQSGCDDTKTIDVNATSKKSVASNLIQFFKVD